MVFIITKWTKSPGRKEAGSWVGQPSGHEDIRTSGLQDIRT